MMLLRLVVAMEEYRIDYCLRSDENFQDWLKGSIDSISRKKEQELLETHHALRSVYGKSSPFVLT